MARDKTRWCEARNHRTLDGFSTLYFCHSPPRLPNKSAPLRGRYDVQSRRSAERVRDDARRRRRVGLRALGAPNEVSTVPGPMSSSAQVNLHPLMSRSRNALIFTPPASFLPRIHVRERSCSPHPWSPPLLALSRVPSLVLSPSASLSPRMYFSPPDKARPDLPQLLLCFLVIRPCYF